MKAVAYIRVSDVSQVEGHSLDAQERLFHELCRNRSWEPVAVYREEGKSAHTDSIARRPVFRQLLEDSGKGLFDLVVVHTMDRWARNVAVAIDSMRILGQHGVELKSMTEDLDRSTPLGKFSTTLVVGMAELFSDNLGAHVRKGVSERARQGKHLGGVPFGYASCYEKGQLRCESEHPGGVHLVSRETEAVKDLFARYASGTVTLSQLASWMNAQGFTTRNTKKLPDRNGDLNGGPKLFTTASVRGILHNAFYTGRVRHKDQLLPGAHEPLLSQDVFHTVQVALKRNSGRSETLHPRPEREYLLKGLVRCAHCLMPLWAQTLKSGSRLYREQARSRSHMLCPADGRSIPCDTPDEQMAKIVSTLVLPDAWMDRVLAQVQLADEVKRVEQDRRETEQRLKRLAQVYLDNLVSNEEYRRQKRHLEDRLASLVVPGVDAAREAGKLLEDLPRLWEEVNLAERRKLLLTMLDAVYVDTVEEKAVVAMTPKPAFMPLFEVATTREGSEVVLLHEKDLPSDSLRCPEGNNPCLWWRRGRVELPVQKTPRWNMLQACPAI